MPKNRCSPTCCRAKKDTYAINHRDFLLDKKFLCCKVQNINALRKYKQPKKHNWKQKFQKTKMKTAA